MILGLDISTSITGLVVMDYDYSVKYQHACDTRNKKYYSNILEKAFNISESLEYIRNNYNIDHIFIEESLQSFRAGFSSAKTLSTLSKINGIISYQSFIKFNIMPIYLSAASARKSCGIKRIKNIKGKVLALEFNILHTPEFKMEYTSHGNPKPYCYDISDALVIARSGVSSLQVG